MYPVAARVRLLIKITSARAAATAGINQLKILHMASIKLTGRTFPPGTPPAFPVKNKIQEELRRKRINITGRKRQAASLKLQAASFK